MEGLSEKLFQVKTPCFCPGSAAPWWCYCICAAKVANLTTSTVSRKGQINLLDNFHKCSMLQPLHLQAIRNGAMDFAPFLIA